MLVCRGGREVGKGTYWNVRNGRRIDVDGDACLPGGDASVYLRARAAMLLVVGPFIGLLYAVLFPFISLGVVLSAAVHSFRQHRKPAGEKHLLSLDAEKRLSGRKKEGEEGKQCVEINCLLSRLEERSTRTG